MIRARFPIILAVLGMLALFPLPVGVTEISAAEGEPAVTLDFEGELIEGEKKGPDLLYQTENMQMQLDDILYTRSDFNDIHSSDSKKRPRFSTLTRARAQQPQPAQRNGGAKP